MQRLDKERGATAVMVALLMVPLIGVAAIAIDVADIYAERQQLQTGADAAALAVAQDCARGNCGDYDATAQSYATANANDGKASGTTASPGPTSESGVVTVVTEGISEHWFAPILGFDQTEISAAATARWGYPTGGTTVLPLAISECEFAAQVKAQGGNLDAGIPKMITLLRTKDLKKQDLPTDWPCAMPQSGNHVPGGFGWLKTNPGTCTSTTKAGDTVTDSDPGNSIPSNCDTADLVDARNKTVLLPLFDESGGQGNSAWFNISGYAAFTIKGYAFVGKAGDTWGVTCPKSVNTCISGHFVEYVDTSSALEYGTNPDYDFGAAVVALTK